MGGCPVRARVDPGAPGLPGGAGPRPRLAPPSTRGSAPPGHHRDGREAGGGGGAAQGGGPGEGREGREPGVEPARELAPDGGEGRARPVTRPREGLAGSRSWGRLVREEGRGRAGR